jgi:hypothetical protein
VTNPVPSKPHHLERACLVVIHAVITTRDGYCVSLTNQLAATLRHWRRHLCGWRGACLAPFIWLLERIGPSSARPVPHEYLAPYHMKVRKRGSQVCLHGPFRPLPSIILLSHCSLAGCWAKLRCSTG